MLRRRSVLAAIREVLLAEQLQRMMRSDRAVIEFEDLRFKLARTQDKAAAAPVD